MSKERTTPGSYSLQRRLLWLLGLAIILIATVQAVLAYRAALDQADAAFDTHMKQLAQTVRAANLEGQRANQSLGSSDFVIQAWTRDGRLVYQSKRRALPSRRQPGYSIAQTGDKTYRVFTTDRSGVSVQVSQDMVARAQAARSEALTRIWPILLLAPLLVLLTIWVIRRSLAPVDRVRRELSERQVGALEPVNPAALPNEVSPLVHELNRLFERVTQTLDSQQDFVADAAHELRSPLTALKLQIQNLQKNFKHQSEEDLNNALERLNRGVERASRMTDQLISMAQQQALISESSDPQPVALDEIAQTAVSQLIGYANDMRVDLGVARSVTLTVNGWPEALGVMINNLVENAIKYTPATGIVDVSVTLEGGRPSLIVEDSGPGIEPAIRERVLDRFYRGKQAALSANDESTAQIRGSGLGLAIVKAVADRHQADVQLARSPKLGGLRVRIQFPQEP
jgi:two-component system OmpR family sensor kinase